MDTTVFGQSQKNRLEEMIHFLLALNIRGQVRLCRFYSPIQGKVEEKTPQNKVGKIPKPVFRNEKSTSKSNASISLFEQLASTSKVGLSKSNSTTDFEKKGGIVRAKSLKLPHTSSGSSLIDVTDSPADPLSHSVPAPNIIAKDESNKKLSEDNVDLIGLWEIDQEQKNVSRLSRNKEDTASRNSTRKELEHTKKGASTTGFIPYRIYLEGETSPGTKAFIDQIYAQVVSMDYQNTPNFMQVRLISLGKRK